MNEVSQKSKNHREWFYGILLVAVIFLTYRPVWNGQPLLDDTDHLISNSESSFRGLLSLWIAPPSRQYHPLVDTVFWLGKNLWSGSMLGYHLATISLHATAALLLVRILKHFDIPGAWLTAAIFALHPVQVESVAWVVELKNTLSGVLFLICILIYSDYAERPNKTRCHILLLVAFVLGMMAKPILATLPAVILIVQWWQKGTIEWRKNIVLWAPLVVLGIIGALFAVWMERELSGAEREIILLSPMQRLLVAGRAFCFYLGKIIWPTNLSFMYPRWRANPLVWWQYLFPLAAILIFIVAWELRSKSRAPLAGLLFFLVTIFPLLGFFNVSFFRFSFVADHFQYLPIIGIITPIAAGGVLLLQRTTNWGRLAGYIFCAALLFVLAELSWAHAHNFTDQVTCYRAVVKHDPASWTAHLNLGFDALARHSSDEARQHFQTILETNGDNPPAAKQAHLALGAMLIGTGEINEAVEHLEKAIEIDPNYAEAHADLATILLRNGSTRRGIAELRKATDLARGSPEMKLALAWQLATCFDPSLRNAREAIELAERAESSVGQNNASALRVLAAAHAELGEFKEAGELARQGLQSALAVGDQALARKIDSDIQLYDFGRPNHNSSD